MRTVDHNGGVLDIPVQERRDRTAAKPFLKRRFCGLPHEPRRLITDGLRSYVVTQRALLPGVRHRTTRYLNDRPENSRRPTRRRERQMQLFKSFEQARHFLSAHGLIYNHFHRRCHLRTAAVCPSARAQAFRIWRQET